MNPTSHRFPGLRSLWTGAALAVGLLAGAAAVAQTSQQQEQAGTLGEVVVTAQFRQQKLQDTPIAITAVDASVMESRSQNNIAQVADNAPNVTFRPQGASFGPSIIATIRGVGQNDFTPAYEPGVGIYIDDVYFPSMTGAVFDLLDLDRVEILRGPQGTLAGRNSEGGAIKLYSKKPTGEEGGFAEATAGSRNRIGLRAAGDFKLSDTVSARISGVFKRQDGYVDQIDFGCAHPAGSDPLNPAGGIPRTQAVGDCTIAKLGGIGYEAVRGIVRFTPNDNFELMLSADYTHDSHTVPGEVLLATGPVFNSPNDYATTINPAVNIPYDSRFICGPYCNYGQLTAPPINFFALPLFPGGPTLTPPGGQPLLGHSISNQSVYDSYDLGTNLHWKLNDTLSIDNILAYTHYKTTWDNDDDLSPTNFNLAHNVQYHWNWSEELRLNAKLSDAVNLVVGGYYFKQQSEYWSLQDIRYIPVFPLQFIQPDVIPADSKAAFANVGWEIVHNLNLNAGVRYTKESKEYHYFRLNLDGTVNPYLDPVGAVYGVGYNGPDTLGIFGGGNVQALSGSVAHYEGSKTDYRAALDYRFSPELMAYASVSTGFKGGGTNPRPFFADQVISFNPETLTNYEVGIKSDLFDRRLRLNLTGFYSKVKDVQIPVLACPESPCAARLNAGDADSKGIELELQARPIDALEIDASYSYLNFHFTSLNPSAEYPSNPAGATTDDPGAGVPKQKFTLGAQYEIALGNSGTLTPRIDVDYQGEVYTGYPDVENVGTPNQTRTLIYTPSFAVSNARLTWRNQHKDLDVALEVTNLANKYYLLSVFDLRGVGAGFDKGQPARPREWAITVKRNFGAK